ncbi:MAG TPA: hypothetical protein PKE65_08850 [Rhizobiaceae bacterium]|nr:hypothetical protein [Rhizobiaceae bacterium]
MTDYRAEQNDPYRTSLSYDGGSRSRAGVWFGVIAILAVIVLALLFAGSGPSTVSTDGTAPAVTSKPAPGAPATQAPPATAPLEQNAAPEAPAPAAPSGQ